MPAQNSIFAVPVAPQVAVLPGFPIHTLGAWLTSLVDSEDNGVFIVDRYKRIVLVNHEAARMFGYGPAALLNMPLELLLPEPVRASYIHQVGCFAATRVAGRRLRIKLDLQGRRENGEEFFIGTSLARLTVEEDTYLSIVVRELTAQQSPDTSPFEQRRLAGSSQKANEVEKRHFSRALYDDVGQHLSVLKLDLDWCERQSEQASIMQRLAQMQRLLDGIISNTKNIASSLRPPLLDEFGLVAATEWLTERFRKRTGIRCRLKCRDSGLQIGEVTESAIFRIIQEALMNIEQHAEAQHVDVTLWRSERQVHVVVEDDGVGLHGSWNDKPGSLGLMAMQERIAILGGTMHLKSLDPSGVAVLASLPIASPLPAMEKP